MCNYHKMSEIIYVKDLTVYIARKRTHLEAYTEEEKNLKWYFLSIRVNFFSQ